MKEGVDVVGEGWWDGDFEDWWSEGECMGLRGFGLVIVKVFCCICGFIDVGGDILLWFCCIFLGWIRCCFIEMGLGDDGDFLLWVSLFSSDFFLFFEIDDEFFWFFVNGDWFEL